MKLLSRQDILIIAVLAACVLLLFGVLLLMPKGGFAVVEYGGNTVAYSLSTDGEYVFKSEGYTLTLEIKDGKARIKDADCPDRVCVGTGFVSRAGSSIVCVPAKLCVRIVTGDGGADFVAG